MHILKRTVRIARSALVIIITIIMFLAVIVFFRWIGIKGLIGFAVGGLAMGYVLLTKNTYVTVFREMMLE